LDIIVEKESKPLPKHSAVAKDIKIVLKHSNTSLKEYPLILPNLSNKKYILRKEKKVVNPCPMAVSIKEVLYCIADFKWIEKYFK